MTLERASQKIEKFIKGKLRFEVRQEVQNKLKSEWSDLEKKREHFRNVITVSKAISSAFEEVFNDKSLEILKKRGYYHNLKRQVVDIFSSMRVDKNTKKILLEFKDILGKTSADINGLLEKTK